MERAEEDAQERPHRRLVEALEVFLANGALEDTPLETLLEGFATRARAGGLPLARLTVAWRMLDPVYATQQYSWTPGGRVVRERWAHGFAGTSEEYLRSPIHHVLTNDIDVFRRRIFDPAERAGFPLFDDLAALGLTDYVLTVVGFGKSARAPTNAPGAGVMIGVCSDAPRGFSEADERAIMRLRHMLAIATRTAILRTATEQLTATYLARSAGTRVLQGTVARGDGEVIEAAVWYCDLRGSTALCERLGQAAYIELLNAYFDAAAGPIVEAGGDVLDFIGDAVLAIFPLAEDGVRRAVEASAKVADALETFRVTHADRLGSRPHVADVAGMAIDVGTVTYGNIGTPERLTFSAIGPAVNRVTRMERLTKTLGVPLLVSEPVARAAGCAFERCGTFALEGVPEPRELFRPAVEADRSPTSWRATDASAQVGARA